jgi:hypothetical protein
METLYYCSSISGLKLISSDSSESTLSENCGCKSKIGSLLAFIIKDHEFCFTVGKDLTSGLFYLCERFENSVFSVLKGKRVSIYQFEQSITEDVETCWSDKFIIKNGVEVIKEEVIIDLYEYLIQLNKDGFMMIYKYPDKISDIPEDDQDLIDLAIIKYRMYGESVMHTISKYHPHLLERLKAGLSAGAFKEYGI